MSISASNFSKAYFLHSLMCYLYFYRPIESTYFYMNINLPLITYIQYKEIQITRFFKYFNT
jgi:hypothetical protein